ncbi:hypothetical protein KW798_03600 [Candidatus Parcubacteria bacterium]|nr:hypothetical protein [Candidatus Parcubacteria bacterium]
MRFFTWLADQFRGSPSQTITPRHPMILVQNVYGQKVYMAATFFPKTAGRLLAGVPESRDDLIDTFKRGCIEHLTAKKFSRLEDAYQWITREKIYDNEHPESGILLLGPTYVIDTTQEQWKIEAIDLF